MRILNLKQKLLNLKRELKAYKSCNNIIKKKLTDKQIEKLFSSLDINEQITLLDLIKKQDFETYTKISNNRTLALIRKNLK